ncbi:MAG: hypothetical protein PGMFKBFP_01552 [Anaerolineales bacterium]|nr:hypothetical protein [Anaerolineales bacterium]
MRLQRGFGVVQRQDGEGRQQPADHHHIEQAAVARLFGDLVAGDEDDGDIVAFGGTVHHALVDDQHTARLEQFFIFIEGRQVQRDDRRRILDQRGADLLVRDDHGAVGRPAAHFGAVGGDPRHGLARVHGRVRQHLSREQHALSAKPCDENFFLHCSLREIHKNSGRHVHRSK